MRTHTLIAALAVAGVVTAASASAQMIQSPSVTIETHRAGAIEYITGGVGEQERAAMRSIGNDYNLKVVTAAPSGNLLNVVDLTVADTSGTPILNAQTEGPLFYAKLPEGQYNVIAKVDGRTFQAPVRVGSGAAPELTLNIPVTATGATIATAPVRTAPAARAPAAPPSRVVHGGSRDPKATPDEYQRHISLYEIDPSAANAQAEVTLYEVYPDGTTRRVAPGATRPAPGYGDAESDADITIQIEPVPEPGAALPPPPAVIWPYAYM
jgi:hypothetical protein